MQLAGAGIILSTTITKRFFAKNRRGLIDYVSGSQVGCDKDEITACYGFGYVILFGA